LINLETRISDRSMANMMGMQEEVRPKTMEELDFDRATKIIMDLLVEQINQEAPRRILG
jgi:hypothetical protein